MNPLVRGPQQNTMRDAGCKFPIARVKRSRSSFREYAALRALDGRAKFVSGQRLLGEGRLLPGACARRCVLLRRHMRASLMAMREIQVVKQERLELTHFPVPFQQRFLCKGRNRARLIQTKDQESFRQVSQTPLCLSFWLKKATAKHSALCPRNRGRVRRIRCPPRLSLNTFDLDRPRGIFVPSRLPHLSARDLGHALRPQLG
jgi:hypothetical protein